MFKYGVDVITNDSEIQLGRYTSHISMRCGDAVLPICNVDSKRGIDKLQFNLRWFRERMFLLPDLSETDRNTFAFKMEAPGYELVSISQGILVYQFDITDNSITIIGREYPELYFKPTFFALFRDVQDPNKYLSIKLVHAGSKYAISERVIEGRENLPNRIPRDRNTGEPKFSKHLVIGSGGKLCSCARCGRNSIVYVNPEFDLWKRSKDPLPLWVNDWFHGGMDDDAACNLYPLEDLRKKFDRNNANELITLIENGTNVVFIGYPFVDMKTARLNMLRAYADKFHPKTQHPNVSTTV